MTGDQDMTAIAHAAPSSVISKPADRDVWQAMRRGFFCRCPNCGQGKLYRAYLKVADDCSVCGTEFHHHRADDAPPYFTMSIVAHIVVAALLAFDEFWPDAPYWLHAVLWSSLVVVASLWLLPLVKGVLIGYQWALRMHGFGDGKDEDASFKSAPPKPAVAKSTEI